MKLHTCSFDNQVNTIAARLAQHATQALLDEVHLSPKPGLVDRRGSGAHKDLTLALMECSAHSLTPTFHALVLRGWQSAMDIALRQEVGRLGREGERQMMAATGGVNTHRGAIWALGLLVTAMAVSGATAKIEDTVQYAANLASLPDDVSPIMFSKGRHATQRYRVPGAREEAQQGFPHIMQLALPQLRLSRLQGAKEKEARLDALIAIMTSLSDTCVLTRGGMPALIAMQQGAKAVLQAGGMSQRAGREAFFQLEQRMLTDNASPGGAADLLAATLFLDRVARSDEQDIRGYYGTN
ncbi:triphosphoribosyl-dephospho-CoA synthase [Providencia burhodogranariea]|uniref:2-(5''-triphosphoribosyl)-3'-dephosphocoenzyme-A synthase n=1 Tax=Providencia burhodogranariea DSM 19968 TaxID=1141662 RepID=K8WSL1_9GAMM|nr:triphosphoribosyl-dephospho-CoA synthase MdcB [Providencia burhodogranariea DSM 19968]